MTHTAQNSSSYFDLTAEVSGYLSRIRWVKPSKGARFLACSMLVSRNGGGVTYFDMKVVGSDAISLISSWKDSQERIFARIRVGDFYPVSYEKNGQVKLQVKGRVLKVLAHGQEAQAQSGQMLVRGLGYLNRVADVRGKCLCSISALNGEIEEQNNVPYVAFDLETMPGALPGIQLLRNHIPGKRVEGGNYPKILVGFQANDIYPDSFVYNRGKNAGQTSYVLKGQLSTVSWAKVDGKKVDIPAVNAPGENHAEAVGNGESVPSQNQEADGFNDDEPF